MNTVYLSEEGCLFYGSGEPQYLKVSTEEGYGIINSERIQILPCVYEDIKAVFLLDDPFFIVTENSRKGLFDQDGKMLIPAVYEELISKNSKGKLIARVSSCEGVVDDTGKVIIPLEHEKIESIGAGFIGCKNNKYGLYDGEGELILPFLYDSIEHFYMKEGDDNDDYFIVSLSGKYGVVDNENNFRIPCIFDKLDLAFDVSNNLTFCIFTKILFRVLLNGKYGLVGMDFLEDEDYPDGLYYLECEYDHIGKPLCMYKLDDEKGSIKAIQVVKDKKVGFLNYELEDIIPNEYDLSYCDVVLESLSYIWLEKGGKWGCLTPEGLELVPFIYDSCCHGSNHLFTVGIGGNRGYGDGAKHGVIDAVSGKVLISTKYDDIKGLRDELFIVKENQCWGVINKNDKVLIPIIYDDISYDPFTGELTLLIANTPITKHIDSIINHD